MSQRLPELIEPDRMAETGRLLKGTLAISKMKRLRPLLLDKEGGVEVDLVFAVDASGQSIVTGHVSTDIKIECQRCMKAMDFHIAEKISLAIIHHSRQANDLPSQYDPLIVDDEMVSLPELVEDELLLALPTIPLHAPEDCQVKIGGTYQEESLNKKSGSSQLKDPERKNPFDVLKQLKKKD
jgi:uncharacterized protein